MPIFKLLHKIKYKFSNITPQIYEKEYCSNPDIKHKRAIIFAMYDINGQIPRNLVAYLKELKKYSDYIILCSDCEIKAIEAEKVANIVDYVYLTRHGEYDFGSYKRGWNILKKLPFFNQIENVTFCNDSVRFAGHSFEEYFKNQINYDAYSLTINSYAYRLYEKGFPICYQPHMQSFLFSLSKNIYKTTWFNNFISNIKKMKRKHDICIKYEVGFSDLILKHNFNINSYYPENKYTKPSGYYLNLLSPYKGKKLLYKKSQTYKYVQINPKDVTRIGQCTLIGELRDKFLSIKNDGNHKVITISGIKIKLKKRKKD